MSGCWVCGLLFLLQGSTTEEEEDDDDRYDFDESEEDIDIDEVHVFIYFICRCKFSFLLPFFLFQVSFCQFLLSIKRGYSEYVPQHSLIQSGSLSFVMISSSSHMIKI